MKRIMRFCTMFCLSIISLTGGWLLFHLVSGYIFTALYPSTQFTTDQNVGYTSNEIAIQATTMPWWANGNVWFIGGLSLIIAAYFSRKSRNDKTKKAILHVT